MHELLTSGCRDATQTIQRESWVETNLQRFHARPWRDSDPGEIR